MKVLVNITSYNRKKKLLNLISQVMDYDFLVWDDCSDFDLKIKEFRKFTKNYGKELAWMKFKYIFKELKNTEYDYYIFLPDDVVLCDDFVNKVISIWEEIKDEKKICLSFSSVERTKHHNWTAYDSYKVGNVIKTQWNDLMFLCTKDFFNTFEIEMIDPERFTQDPLISSGVGRQISIKLNAMGYSLYNLGDDLLTHIGNDDSKMNPEIRKDQPL